MTIAVPKCYKGNLFNKLFLRGATKTPLFVVKASDIDPPQLEDTKSDFEVPKFGSIPDIIKFVDPNDPEKWVTIRSESVEFDRAEFIVDKFKETYPDITLPTDVDEAYELIGKLASRSSLIAEWLSNTSVLYSEEAQTPAYLLPFIKPNEFKKVQSDVTNYNKIARRESDESVKAALEYRDKMRLIRDKYDKERKKIREVSNFVKVLTIPSTKLPLTVQLAIENFTPQDVEDSASKRQYARELLTDYKIFILDTIKNNPKADVDAIVEANRPK